MKCSHFGGSRHTKDGCFKIIGYPDWWDDLQKRKAATKAPTSQTSGKALLMVVDYTDGKEDHIGGETNETKVDRNPTKNITEKEERKRGRMKKGKGK